MNRDIIQLKEYYDYINTANPDIEGTNYSTIFFIEPKNLLRANIEYSESINLDSYWKSFNILGKNIRILFHHN